ncbi:MAG: hypothetical protein ACK4YP_02670 [Myxococcota bacterium]
MREFTGRGPALRRLDRGARVVYSAFLVFLLVGLATAGLLHWDGMGATAAGATTYWRGDEPAMVYPKSFRQILEVTHFHLFTEPVVWLVVAHLYHMGGGRGLVSLGTLGAIALQIALPWCVSYVSPVFGALFLPVTAGVVLGLAWMIVDSLREMWSSRS